jgi:hypothetical protein
MTADMMEWKMVDMMIVLLVLVMGLSIVEIMIVLLTVVMMVNM